MGGAAVKAGAGRRRRRQQLKESGGSRSVGAMEGLEGEGRRKDVGGAPEGGVAGERVCPDLGTGEARADSIAVDPAAPSEAGMIGLSAAPDTVEHILGPPLSKRFYLMRSSASTPRA